MDSISYPILPFTSEIPQGMFIGKSIQIHGVVPSHSNRFAINLLCCPIGDCIENSDIALHLSVRFDQKAVVLNSYLNNQWKEEVRHHSHFPFHKGTPFEMSIFCQESHFQIFVNGKDSAKFTHRLPPWAVKGLQITGDVTITTISYQAHQNSNAVSSHLTPIYRPATPIRPTFSRGLHPMVIKIDARTVPSSKRFTIDFLMGQDDIAMHFNVRFDQMAVVLNNRINNKWGSEHSGNMVFIRGEAFTLLIEAKKHDFHFIMNGQPCGHLRSKASSISSITSMDVTGDLIISNIQFEQE